MPLVLMNSFSTHEDTMAALAARHPELEARGLLRAFVQNRFPRIEVTPGGCQPLSLPDPDDNWNPPGHGDLYPSILVSGILDDLLDQGIEVAFVSNSDNLGAVMDPRVAAHMLERGEDLPFLMEVRKRGKMDRKGGHLAVRVADDQLVLREIAQCPGHQVDAFQDIRRYGYFNTNNLWVNLRALKRALEEAGGGFLPLPMICNGKDVQGHDVVQLETAMGAAVEMFPGAAALVVPRSRYAPVKTTDHLLVVRSDAYELDRGSYQLVLTGGRAEPPVVTLNPKLYKTVAQLERAFPEGIPSLRECTSLTIESEAVFPAATRFAGDVVIR
jgi:UTP--glucose-1-phosphate uridylyltransferase